MTDYRHLLDEFGDEDLSVDEELECLDESKDCRGDVTMWTTDGLKYWPRCEFHGERRLASYENSIERYANSDVAPSWFDPTYAGERWDDDY